MSSDWSRLKAFYYSAINGSFTAAAEKTFVTQPSVSRKITTLEENLGVQLFHRTPKGLVLTEAGNILFKAVQKMSNVYEEMETTLQQGHGNLSGTFSIAIAAHLISSNYFIEKLSKFTTSYPNIKVSVQDSPHGWVAGTDLAIVPLSHLTENLSYDHITTLKPSVWASKDYYKTHMQGNKEPLDLSKCSLIAYSSHLPYSRVYNWHAYQGNNLCEKKICLWLPSVDDVICAVAQNFGVGAFPKEFIPPYLKKQLVCLKATEDKSFNVDLYYTYLTENANSKKVRAFIASRLAI